MTTPRKVWQTIARTRSWPQQFRIVYLRSKLGQTVGQQMDFITSAENIDEAKEAFARSQAAEYNYHILYWE